MTSAMVGLGLLASAAALLVVGAETFVEQSAGAAGRLGLSVLAVGVLLAGAEPEELVTAVSASVAGRPGLAVGDALGANITMLTAAVGLAALARPLPVGGRVRRYAVIAALGGAAALAAVADGRVGRWEGSALVLGYAVAVAAVWRWERRPPTFGELAELAEESSEASAGEPGHDGAATRTWRPLVLAVVGLAVMLAGGIIAVAGASRVADALGGRDGPVGLTLLALATSAELFALVLAATRHAVPEVAVAGLVGSALYNATVTLGAAALVRPLEAPGFTIAATAAAVLPLVLLLLSPRGRLGRPAGAALAAGYVGYVLLVLS